MKKAKEEPTISYLCQGGGSLFYKDTSVADTGKFHPDNYNEDFPEFDQKLKAWAAKEESCGLSILHGIPGTGKTYYLRHLAGKIKNLTYIPSGIAHEIGSPAFLLFLSENPGRVFVIEDAEGVLVSDGVHRSSALQNLLNATDGLMGDIIKSKFIFTFNTGIENIDQALLRSGRAAVVYKFDKLSEARTTALCEKLGQEKKADQMTLAEIYNAEVSGVDTLKTQPKRIIGFGK
jgi:SpoVK/Ycf46/Vps4 family AAA+-type ATPase